MVFSAQSKLERQNLTDRQGSDVLILDAIFWSVTIHNQPSKFFTIITVSLERFYIDEEDIKMEEESVSEPFKCSMCEKEFTTLDGVVIFHHVRHSHRTSSRFSTFCPVYNCKYFFNKYLSFERHWYSMHDPRKGLFHLTRENLLPLSGTL